MDNDATQTGEATQADDDSSGTQSQGGSDSAAEIASYRKRQAGAEAARQVAEGKAKELEQRLAKYEAATQTAAEKDLSELAATKARLEAAERRAQEAEVKAEARILDAKYPNARKEFPEIADEARLAKYEVIFGEDDADDLPTPLKHQESRSASAAPKQKELTADDVKAQLLSMPVPWARVP